METNLEQIYKIIGVERNNYILEFIGIENKDAYVGCIFPYINTNYFDIIYFYDDLIKEEQLWDTELKCYEYK